MSGLSPHSCSGVPVVRAWHPAGRKPYTSLTQDLPPFGVPFDYAQGFGKPGLWQIAAGSGLGQIAPSGLERTPTGKQIPHR
jgi:hypothetical protein